MSNEAQFAALRAGFKLKQLITLDDTDHTSELYDYIVKTGGSVCLSPVRTLKDRIDADRERRFKKAIQHVIDNPKTIRTMVALSRV